MRACRQPWMDVLLCRQSGCNRLCCWCPVNPQAQFQRVHHQVKKKDSRMGGGFSHLFGQALVADFAPFAALFREVLDTWDAIRPEALRGCAER